LLDKRRLRSFIVMGGTLVATPLYVVCGFRHVCMAGHMQHPPYSAVDWGMDVAWLVGFLLGAVGCLRSDLCLRRSLSGAFALLIVSRLAVGSGAGALFFVEFPLLVLVLAAIVGSLFFP